MTAVLDNSANGWFVARTQPKRERWAAENVSRTGAEYYLPQVLDVERFVQNGVRRREFRIRPLFPSYLFVRTESGQWHELLAAFGVVGLIPGAGDAPATIRDSVLAGIRAMTGTDGLIALPRTPQGTVIGPNTPARITQGPYAGFKGICQGMVAEDRIKILLDYMGRKVPFIVFTAHLEAVS